MQFEKLIINFFGIRGLYNILYVFLGIKISYLMILKY